VGAAVVAVRRGRRNLTFGPINISSHSQMIIPGHPTGTLDRSQERDVENDEEGMKPWKTWEKHGWLIKN